jgi:hypothetical protein
MDGPIHLGALVKQFDGLVGDAERVAERAQRVVGGVIGFPVETGGQKPLPGASPHPVVASIGQQLNDIGHRFTGALNVIEREISRLEDSAQSEPPSAGQPDRLRAVR